MLSHLKNAENDWRSANYPNGAMLDIWCSSNYLREAKPNVMRDSVLAVFRTNMKEVSEMNTDERDDYREKINLINKRYPDPSANVGHVLIISII